MTLIASVVRFYRSSFGSFSCVSDRVRCAFTLRRVSTLSVFVMVMWACECGLVLCVAEFACFVFVFVWESSEFGCGSDGLLVGIASDRLVVITRCVSCIVSFLLLVGWKSVKENIDLVECLFGLVG